MPNRSRAVRPRHASVHTVGPLAGAIARALHSPATSRASARRPAAATLLAGTLLLSLGVTLPAQAQNWTGAVSDDWFTAANWDNNQVPDGIQISINTDDPNPTVIANGDAVVQSFSIATGPGLEGRLSIINGGSLSSGAASIGSLGGQGSLTVSGTGSNWTASNVVQFGGNAGTGTLSVLDGGAVVFSIGVDHAVAIGAGGIGNATVSGTGSSLTTPGGLQIGRFQGGVGTLAIADGGTVAARTAMLGGDFAGAQGSITVDGDGSSLGISNALTVGGAGIGTLDVTGGGTASAGAITLGQDAGSQGELEVGGAGSLLTHTGSFGEFVVGLNGSGTLTITAGGTVDGATNAFLGAGAGSGEATVTGAGAQWLVDGLLAVGHNGSGTLSVAEGGRVEAVRLDVGNNPGGTGLATVDGDGSVVQLQGLGVGTGGSGSLEITGGGRVEAALGATVGSVGDGTVTVTGPGSVLDAGGISYVGFNNATGRVDVLAGGVVNAAETSIGHTQDAQGTVSVSGAGSQWSNSGLLTVGNNASGVLAVGEQGVVESGDARLGETAVGQGAATVDGPGSAWNVGGNLFVGVGGSGTLDITGGGAVVTGNQGVIGYSADSAGTVNVTGPDSAWTLGDALQVGREGAGELVISDGGVVTLDPSSAGAAYLTVGSRPGSSGTMTVTGAGSTWTGRDGVIVGDAGVGSLTIEDGGVVSDGLGILGNSASGVGTAFVRGAGSQWNSSGFLWVGRAGNGELIIEAGGSVASASGALGVDAGGVGEATVDGAGSLWQIGGAGDSFLIGDGGSGSLAISGGGAVSNAGAGVLGAQAGAQGTVTVSGAGSSWGNAGALVVGRGGSGALEIDAGGAVSSTIGWLGEGTGAQGAARVNGAGSSWAITSDLVVGFNGSGELVIDAGGAVNDIAGYIGLNPGARGTVAVSGAGSSWVNAGQLLVGAFGIGELFIDDGGAVSSAYGAIGASAGAQGSATVRGAGTVWEIGDGLAIAGAGNGSLVIADGGMLSSAGRISIAFEAGSVGTLNIGAGEGEAAAAAGTLDAPSIAFGAGAGTINFNHTAGDYLFDAAINGSGSINQLAGTTILTGAGDTSGTTNVQGGTLLVEGTLGDTKTTVFDGATLGGSGAIGGDVTVQNGGILAPGSSAGTLTLGSLSLSAGSLLDYELGQAGVIGSGVNDLIQIGGNLTLDGTLDITDIGGFGAGVYRLMNYGGALTDNGLEFGTLPTDADAQDLFLQTAIVGQVNLVNSTGLTLSFWDGTVASEHNNGAIDDGNGAWNTDNDNWTAADGAVNGRWDAGTFAVFGGAGGTVDVAGEQAVAGIQFMAGYTLQAGAGGALRIDGAESVIRVDPTVTATIAAPIVGAGGLVKTDTGTLVLSGTNTYSGGTAIDMGTLQVLADNNLGDAAGTLSFDGGTLRNTAAFTSSRAVTLEAGGGTFETAADLTLSGVIDGDGALAKTGDGTLTLTGTNSYAGGTLLEAGTLSVSADANLGDAAGALTLAGGTLQNTAAFDSTREVVLAGGTLQTDADLGLSGTVSGAAALIKDGAGTLTLTGDNTYSGDTRVLDGTLVGDVASIRGNIDNAGTVVFDQVVDASFDGVIAGSGDMVKRGAGALTLGAAGAMDWSIDAGALIARAAQFGGDAAIADGATLRFTEAGGAYGGMLSGMGDFEIVGGSNVFALTGNSSGFDGTTSLESGTLRIDGSLGGLTVIATGATLGGTGTLGSVDNAGTVAAGNSIGTLTLTGDYFHRDDATLLAEIESGGSSDLLDVAGAATIEGGIVDIIKLPGQYEGGTRYTLIDAAGGVTGTFDTLDQDLPFLDLLLVYDPGHVYLDVARNDVDFDIVCGDGTFNQCQVAGALDRVGDAETITPDLIEVLTEVTTLTLDQARAGFDRLSGEAHTSLAGAMLEGHALYGRTVARRLAERREAVGAQRLQGGVWARGYGLSSELDGDGNAHGAELELYGLAVGADAWASESWLLGASLNTLKLDADFRPGDGGEADAKNLALYTSVHGERVYFDAVASYAWWDAEVQRQIEVGDIARETRSDYGMHRFAAYLEAGLTYEVAGGTLQPLLSAEWSLLSTEGFREQGADDVNLIGSAQNVERTVAALGLRWSGEYGSGEWSFAPSVQARWLHTFGDLDAEFDVAFAGAPEIGYRVRGVTVPEDRGLLGVGFQASRDTLDLFVDLDYQAGDGFRAASLGAGLRWRW